MSSPPSMPSAPSPITTEPARRTASTVFILVTVLLDTLGLGLIIPVGPRLVASFLHDDLKASAHWFGLLVALYALMQFLFAPVLGALSDRFGRRPVILMSLLGAAMSYLVSGFAPVLWWLFAGRVVAGITGASFSCANAYIADITAPEKRAQSFGLVGAVFGLGFILGPAVGGLLGDVGLRLPYFIAAGLNGVNLLYGLFVLPESLPKASRRPFSFARANAFGSLIGLSRYPIVLGLTGTMACSYLAQWILQSVWTLDTQARFGWTLRMVGVSLMVVGFSTAIVQGVLVRVAVRRLGERKSLVAGLVMAVVGHACMGLSPTGSVMLACIFPLALGGLAGPAIQAILTRYVAPTEQGELQGSLNSLAGIAAIVGPLIGTSLLARFGSETSSPHIPGAAFLAGSAISAIGLVLAVRQLRRTPSAPVTVTVEAAPLSG